MKHFKIEQFLRQKWPYLIVIMVGVVLIQTWWLIRMQRQINQRGKIFHGDTISNKFSYGSKNQNGFSLLPNNPLADNSFNHPFDLNSWDPFQEMQNMQDRMNSMFGDAFGRFSRSPQFGDLFDDGGFSPNIDIRDEGDHFIVKIDLPGAEESNVNISCKDQELTISGTIDQLQESRQGGSLLRRERRSGSFSRTIPLPAPVEVEKMETKFDRGVVTIMIPKAKP